jgi:hypothetical protein
MAIRESMLQGIPCGALVYPSLSQKNLSPIDSIPHSCYASYMTKRPFLVYTKPFKAYDNEYRRKRKNVWVLQYESSTLEGAMGMVDSIYSVDRMLRINTPTQIRTIKQCRFHRIIQILQQFLL